MFIRIHRIVLWRTELVCLDTNCCSQNRHCGTWQYDNTCVGENFLLHIIRRSITHHKRRD